jgi:RecB family endonuclease NucS
MVVLHQSGDFWKFRSEAELEDFVWSNLEPLFGVSPLRRQYSVDGQFCDILAVTDDKQLVILELKNVEDRYIVQQLTRYYHALFNDRSLDDRVDYSKPIRLVAIVPSVHKDNLTDVLYSKLLIEVLTFELTCKESVYSFKLKINENVLVTLDTSELESEPLVEIPALTRKWLNRLPEDSVIRGRILKIRQKILSFDRDMKEIEEGSCLLYGKSEGRRKFQWCVELRVSAGIEGISLFLNLPHPSRYSGAAKTRIRGLVSSSDWNQLNGLTSHPKLFQRDPQTPPTMTPAFLLSCYEGFDQCDGKLDSIDAFIDLALFTWMQNFDSVDL